jgi:hypothetical protein
MKTRELEAVWRKVRIEDILPSFVVKGSLAYDAPVGDLLRAVIFDRSSDKSVFFVHCFFQPMFIPRWHLVLGYGDRLRTRMNNEGWSSDRSDLEEELRYAIRTVAKPFLDSVNDLEGVVRYFQRKKQLNKYDANTREYLAASLARLGRLSEAQDEWSELLAIINPTIEWHVAIAQRVTVLQGAFARSMAEGQAQLDVWAAEARANLKLPA